jgi:hypothetical protein
MGTQRLGDCGMEGVGRLFEIYGDDSGSQREHVPYSTKENDCMLCFLRR